MLNSQAEQERSFYSVASPENVTNFFESGINELSLAMSRSSLLAPSIEIATLTPDDLKDEKNILRTLAEVHIDDPKLQKLDLQNPNDQLVAIALEQAKTDLAIQAAPESVKPILEKHKKEQTSKARNFLSGKMKKSLVLLFLAGLTAACSTLPMSSAEVRNEEKGTEVQVSPEIYLEWKEVKDKNTEYFSKLVDSPYQKWENVVIQSDGSMVYTLQIGADIKRDPATEKLTLKTDRAQFDDLTFYQNPNISDQYLENPGGLMLRTNLDERYLKSALGAFPDAKNIEVFVTEIAIVSKDQLNTQTAPRYLDIEKVGIQNIKILAVGPLVPEEWIKTKDNPGKSFDIKSSEGFWATPSYTIKVTRQDGSQSIFIAIPIKTDSTQNT